MIPIQSSTRSIEEKRPIAALEERMLENQIIHFTLDFTENSNSESKKNGERRYRRLPACLTVDRSRLPVSKGSPPP